MEDTDDDCGPTCCMGSMLFACVFFLCSILSLNVGDVVLFIFGIAVLGIVGIWMIYCCYEFCHECWYDLRDNIPVITITIRRPAPDTQPAIINSYKMKRTDVVCTICMEEIKKNSVCKKIPKCGHEFHKKCIDTWFVESKTCPNCRLDV